MRLGKGGGRRQARPWTKLWDDAVPAIAISYRRSDTQGIAGRIHDRLVARFGKSAVFIDIDSIPPGVDFRTHVNEILRDSALLLVLIGPNWLGAETSSSAPTASPASGYPPRLTGCQNRRTAVSKSCSADPFPPRLCLGLNAVSMFGGWRQGMVFRFSRMRPGRSGSG